MQPLALEGIRIIDLTMIWAGPLATRLLADMGAEVIKIESCTRMDTTRVYYAPKNKTGEDTFNWGGYFHKFNRNKLGITVDMTKPRGREIFKKLVKIADIVIDNFSPRVMRNFGLDFEALRKIKEDIIVVSMPAFGTTGPYANCVAWGTNIEGFSGLSACTGYQGGPPMRTGIAYGDPLSAFAAAFAAMAALHYREKTGKGQFIDISQAEVLSSLLGETIMDYVLNQRISERQGNRHVNMAPHGCYRCKGDDKWVTIAVSNEEEWKKLCGVMGHPSWAADEKYSTMMRRWQNQDELDRLIEEWTVRYDHYEVMRTLQAVGVACGAVLDISEIINDAQVKARQFFQNVVHPEVGEYPFAVNPWRLSRTPSKIRNAAPLLGQHNEYVLGKLLNISNEEMEKLKEENIIGTKPSSVNS